MPTYQGATHIGLLLVLSVIMVIYNILQLLYEMITANTKIVSYCCIILIILVHCLTTPIRATCVLLGMNGLYYFAFVLIA